MSNLEIIYHEDGRIAIAYINKPESFNSLNKQILTDLRQFIIDGNNDDKVRCIAISGRGKAFCAGQNLKDALALEQEGEEKVIQKMVTDFYNPLVTEIHNSKKPVISLVNGAAVGAGAMLALICDICLATESSYFSQAFVNIGLIPDTGGTYWLPKLLGRQQANYLAMTGKKLSATDAKSAGIIAEVFADENFENAAMEVLKTIANLPTTAIALIKKAFNESYKNSLEDQLNLEGELQQAAAETADFKEGVAAFLEKRKPVYKGK